MTKMSLYSKYRIGMSIALSIYWLFVIPYPALCAFVAHRYGII